MSSTDTEFSWRLAILIYLCSPVLLVLAAHERFDEKRKQRKTIPALPPIRQRALSIRPTSIHELSNSRKWLGRRRKPKTCLFLDRLPAEIREMIYVEVLGGHVFRIERRKSNLGHISCKHDVEESCCRLGVFRFDCSMYGARGRGEWPPKRVWRESEPDPDANLLGLVKTCRTIYCESIDIIYSHNTFHIPQWTTMVEFTSTILPQRLNSLKTLHLKLLYADIRWSPAWLPLSEQIGGIPGLETLKIVFTGGISTGPFTAGEEKRTLTPLLAIKRPQIFEIKVSWPVKAEYIDAPFKICTAAEPLDNGTFGILLPL